MAPPKGGDAVPSAARADPNLRLIYAAPGKGDALYEFYAAEDVVSEVWVQSRGSLICTAESTVCHTSGAFLTPANTHVEKHTDLPHDVDVCLALWDAMCDGCTQGVRLNVKEAGQVTLFRT